MTVLQACVRRLGVHRGGLAAANVAQLAIATAELGHYPSGSEYAEYWAISDRTAFRHRARARAGLGTEENLRQVVEKLARRLGQERSPRAVLGLPVPAR